MIRRNQQADEDLSQKIGDLRKQDQKGTGFYVDDVYQSFFQDAAHSMAAVGMISPFLEAVFTAIFPSLPRKKKEQGGIAAAIRQLAESNGLAQFFPEDYGKTLDALFLYRNKMFHNGFIWPERVRNNFQKTITDSGWPRNWFGETIYRDSRNKREKPWIFCVSDEFIEHCLWTIGQVLDGYRKFLRRSSEK